MAKEKASLWGDPVVLAAFIAALAPLIKQLLKLISQSKIPVAEKNALRKLLKGS